MSTQKIIRGGESNKETADLWHLPDVSRGGKHHENQSRGLTVKDIERIQKEAYDEAYAQGRKEGFEKGYGEGRAQLEADRQKSAQRLRQTFDILAQPLATLDEEVEQNLLELALTLTRQIVRRELQTQPGEVMAIIREAVALLPLSARHVQVHLHPEDARFVREMVSEANEDSSAWKLVEDPAMDRGGCRVVTESSQIDATLQHRLNQLARDLLGDERDAGDGSLEQPEDDGHD